MQRSALFFGELCQTQHRDLAEDIMTFLEEGHPPSINDGRDTFYSTALVVSDATTRLHKRERQGENP